MELPISSHYPKHQLINHKLQTCGSYGGCTRCKRALLGVLVINELLAV